MIYRPRFSEVEVSAPVYFSGAQYVMMAAGGHVHALPMDVVDVLFTCIPPKDATTTASPAPAPKGALAKAANGNPAAKRPNGGSLSKLQRARRDVLRAALLDVVREAALTTPEVWDHARRSRPALSRMEVAANLAAMAKDGLVAQRECPETRLDKWYEVKR